MIRTVIWGLGAMGSGMARRIASKPGYQIVGAIDLRPELVGSDLADLEGLSTIPRGVIVSADAQGVLADTGPDITMVATNSFVEAVLPNLEAVLNAGSNCITLAEEMAYPWKSHPEEAAALDQLAQQCGVTLLGTGVNPGFVLDTLVLLLTGVCSYVDHIFASRVNNLAEFGPTVMQSQGVGITPSEFDEGIRRGDIVGHVGFRQSIDMIADAVGWSLDEIVEERQPILSSVQRISRYARVEAGMVAGCNHVAYGTMNGREMIRMEHPQQVMPELEDVSTGDRIVIAGKPDIRMEISPEIPGGVATINLAVNMMASVLTAPPGLKTMLDLPLPHYTCLDGC